MTNSEAEQLLQTHGIRPTSNRILIVQTLDKRSGPCTQKDIEMELLSVDKSSVSRVLSTLLEHDLVHLIPGPAGADLYELCRDNHDQRQAHSDEHAHFFCTKCGRTWCLHDVVAPRVPLPKGFIPKHSHFVVTGICDCCNKNIS